MTARMERGAILVQVLIMGALLLMLVTLLVKAVNQNFHVGAYVVGEARETKNAELSVNAVSDAWANYSACPSPPNCAPTPTNCVNVNWASGFVKNVGPGGPNSCNCRMQVFIKPDPAQANFTRYPDVVAATNAAGDCQIQTDLTQMLGQYTYP